MTPHAGGLQLTAMTPNPYMADHRSGLDRDRLARPNGPPGGDPGAHRGEGGVLTVVVVGVIQRVASDSIELLNAPVEIVALVAFNVIGGLLCGLIAWGLQTATRGPA